MPAEIVHLTLKSRKVHEIKMQRESTTTPGKALKKAIEYVGVSDREIFGPYEEGCVNDGCLCYNVPTQKQKGGTIINVGMSGQESVQAWYKADDLVSLFGDNAELFVWPDALGNYDLGAKEDYPGGVLRHNGLNGHATVTNMAGNSAASFFSDRIADIVVPGGMTCYVVGRFGINAWCAPSSINQASSYDGGPVFDTSWNGALKAMGFQTRFVYDGGWNVIDRRLTYHDGYAGNKFQAEAEEFSANGVSVGPRLYAGGSVNFNEDNQGALQSINDAFHVFAFRYGKRASTQAMFVDAVNHSIPFSEYLWGHEAVQEIPDVRIKAESEGYLTKKLSNGNTLRIYDDGYYAPICISVGWCSPVQGEATGGDLWEMAEVRWYPTEHSDDDILANTNSLREKYGI